MIFFDIDGTLSLPGERLKYIRQRPKDFEAFYAGIRDDKVNRPIADICRALMFRRRDVRIVTGRPERTRRDTFEWLWDARIHIYGECIYMRDDNDYRADTEVKPELIRHLLSEVGCIFENRTKMVEAWRALGITCVQVAKGDY